MKKTLSILLTGLLAVSGVCSASAATDTNNEEQATQPTSSIVANSNDESAQDEEIKYIEIENGMADGEDFCIEFVTKEDADKINEDGSFVVDLNKYNK